MDIKAISTKKVKKYNDIDFAYLYDFDLLFLEGGCFINFCKINEINKELREMKKIVKLFFIKEKILIIFEHDKKTFGQIGSDIHNEFVIDYLISVKENYTRKNGIVILNDILKEEKDYNKFYEFIYKTYHKDQFEYKISDKLILNVLYFKKNIEQNLLNNENPLFLNNQRQANNINQNDIYIPNSNNIQNNNCMNNLDNNNKVQENIMFTNNIIEQNNINNIIKENNTNDNFGININMYNPQNILTNPFHISEQQNNIRNNGNIINVNFNIGNNELNDENKIFLNKLGNFNNSINTQIVINNNINNAFNVGLYLNQNRQFENNNINAQEKIKNIVEKIQKENNNITIIVSTDDTKDMITIYFESGDQVLKCAILCKNTDKFSTIVNKVF